MRRFFLKFQLILEAALLFATLILVGVILDRYDYRWDLTQEKVYSLPPVTSGVLKELSSQPVEVYAFYPQGDDARRGLEVFLRECQRYHPDLRYYFYDPARRPGMAKKFQITQPATILIRAGEREERVVDPNEEAFTNAFLRILHPRNVDVCFTSGHGEVQLAGEDPTSYQMFRVALEGYNARIHEIVLLRDHVPDVCQVVVVAGPRWELVPGELADLKSAFERGKGVLLLLDPMDPGTGQSFIEFAKSMGVSLSENVVVDKTSRIVGGDFLMPLVSQYFVNHPVSKTMKQATFFPLLRSVQPSSDSIPGLEVVPLGMTSAGSWAETDLAALENGYATFDVEKDIAGPLSIAVAIEQKTDDEKPDASGVQPTGSSLSPAGRMIMIGDSDFLNNSYLNLSGNKEFGLRIMQWLAKDERFVEVKKPQFKFKPLMLDVPKQTFLILSSLVMYPLIFFIGGGLYLVIRSRRS
ncbi:MAG TPA: Gldg family protein [Candidatus Omnitrophota bacterium]|nr:Gldg family protein [Candidatus Omnitrophota bacterium]